MIMCLWVRYKKKISKKIIIFLHLKLLKKKVGSGSGVGSHPDPLARGTDPRMRIPIRPKMSRIPNTAKNRA
jgi:hypothetical protein